MTPSKDGKGRTLLEILTGRNKKNLTPLELQVYNPLGAKIGCTISFEHTEEINGINFVIEKIGVMDTEKAGKKFFHTDYYIKGVTVNSVKPLRFRLRLIPDSNESNELGCKIQLLKYYDEMEWDESFHDEILCSNLILEVNYDDQGNELAEPRQYFRVDDIQDSYHSTVTLLADKDGDGTVEESELEKYPITYWDYHRNTDDENGQEFTELLYVEMNDKSHYFHFLRGQELQAFQITVI